MIFYSYLYRDPDTYIPRYAGKGTGGRAYKHLGNRCNNKQLKGWIKKLKDKNIQPIIEIYESIDENHSCFLEECFIQIFGRLDKNTGTLFNHTDGGEGISGYKHTEESKKKIGEAGRGNKHNVGRVNSKSTRIKISLANSGKKKPPRTKEHSLKISIAHSGKICNQAELDQLKIMTEKIKLKVEIYGVKYSSVTEAANILGIHNETLRHRCHSNGFPDYKILENRKCPA